MVNDISSAQSASAYHVTLQNKQSEQQEKIVGTLIESIAATSPAHPDDAGKVLDVAA